MKTLYFVTLGLALFVAHEGFSQPIWVSQNSGTSVDLNDVFFTDTNTGTAVGLDGDIFRTIDGGQNWTFQDGGTSSHLNGVFFTDSNTGTAVGLAGTILRTTDGGQNWVRQNSGTPVDLNDVFFTDTNTGTAVGLDGDIFRTTDGGQNWIFQDGGTSSHLRGVFFTDTNTGTAVGLAGTILRTTDGGQNWTRQTSGTSSHLNSVFFTDTNTGTAVGLAGTILRTTDGGQNWIRQDSGTPLELKDVFFTDENRGTAVGLDGDILRTTDGGQTWTFQDGGTSSQLNGVYFTDANTGTAVGDGGTILRTASCDFALSPTNMSFAPMGGSGSLEVTVASHCFWTATSNVNWITITSGASGEGDGEINYSVETNNNSNARTGTLTIADQTFTVTQSGCTFMISPNSASFQASGGMGTVNVSTEAGCTWTAMSNASWITITSGENGEGSGDLNYSVEMNNSSNSRTGKILVADQTVTITQSGCIFTISPNSASFPASGGTGAVNVSTEAGCTWTAMSNVSWITITSGGSGDGSGDVNYSVGVNNSPNSRNGTLTIAGETFTVAQAGSSGTNQPPLVANPIADQTLNIGEPPFSRDLDASPVVFIDPDGDVLSYSVSSSNTTVASAMLSGSVLSVSAVMDGNATITLTARDVSGQEAETTFAVSVNASPPACWELDSFDDLNPGPLEGQNGWRSVPGRAIPDVIANPFGPGQVLLLDPGQNQTVNIGKNVNDQTTGKHSVKLNVRIAGNPTENSLAKVEIRTTGNPDWDKKFQLYFGAHMRLNSGPTRPEAYEFLSSDELVNEHEYLVEAIVDLDLNFVKILVDGQPKLDSISVGPGAITDISVSAWDRPGRVYYDNLEFCSLGPSQPGECPVTSFFDVNDESWTVIEDVQDPVHFSTGGNPGGYLSATDIGTGQLWFWQAPAKFLGDVSCAYGRALSFDLRHIASRHNLNNRNDIVLEGGGLTLVYDTPYNPDENWTAYSVSLNEDAGWKKDSLSGDPPTQEEMQAVLSSLTNLYIRGEFSQFSGDIGHLDNVVMGGTLKGVGPAVLVSATIVDDDGKIEPGEQVELEVTLRNEGIETVTGISGTITTSDPDITIVDANSTWQDLPRGESGSSLDSFGFEVSPGFSGQRLVEFTLTVMAGNGGPWTGTFELLIGVQADGSVFVVNSSADTDDGTCDADCTLREAINAANSTPNFNNTTPDTIKFNIPGQGAHTIRPDTLLPGITDPVVIDGLSQPGASCQNWPPTLLIELDGSNAGTASGLRLLTTASLVRGLTINRFSGDGIFISGDHNMLECNFIGTDITGTVSLGNETGVFAVSDSNRIGGATVEARNLISGNSAKGLYFQSNFNTVQGNYIGTDVTGTADLGNGDTGVFFDEDIIGERQATSNTIGGSTPGAGNLISANGGDGIGTVLNSNLTIQGNLIGTDVTGTAQLGNAGNGIVLDTGLSIIGGNTAAAGNLIFGNGSNGILILNGIGNIGNAIQGNAIFNNADIGIDLGGDGISANDALDSDTGPNDLQNFPVLNSASFVDDSVTISGTLNSFVLGDFRVEFFSSLVCNGNASGVGATMDSLKFGEGQTFLGTHTVKTDSAGNASFSVTLPAQMGDGSFITATATDSSNNTSEFSACLMADTTVTGIDDPDSENASVPTKFELSQNYPNPFNPETTIRYQLPRAAEVKLEIYNLLGQRVHTLVDEKQQAGHHRIIWNGRDRSGTAVASGIYIYRITAGEFVDVKKLVLIR